MKPILLTKFGEKLVQHPDLKTTDDKKLGSCIGIHDICGGLIHIRPISKTYKAVYCQKCGLRVTIPNGITTYGELRKYISQ